MFDSIFSCTYRLQSLDIHVPVVHLVHDIRQRARLPRGQVLQQPLHFSDPVQGCSWLHRSSMQLCVQHVQRLEELAALEGLASAIVSPFME